MATSSVAMYIFVTFYFLYVLSRILILIIIRTYLFHISVDSKVYHYLSSRFLCMVFENLNEPC